MAAFGGTPVQPGSSSQSTTTEHIVRAPNNSKKKYSMIKFSSGSDIDFLKQTSVKMERENNLKEYKSAYDIDTMPKYGAGSEYGRDQKEEARRKKYGINIKKYNPEDQPWLMKVGTGKNAKRFKGVREGTITENTSYYIFTQCTDDAFEAFPIEEWYNFQPQIRYKYLNVDEAEEEFNKRDRIMNKWSVMARKRVKNEVEPDDPDEGEKKSKSKAKAKKDKSLILTDMDDWAVSSEDDDDDGEADDEDGEGSKSKGKGKKKEPLKKRRNAKMNQEEEAIEESDEGDFDDRELDYITDSGESDADLDEKEKEDKYDDKGVDQEDGLKKLIDSEEESSEEENKEEENEEEEETKEGEKKKKKKKEGGEESDSSSSSSGSESDIEKDEKISSVLFMQKKKSGSRSSTPTIPEDKEKQALKRKLEPDEALAKKPRTDSPLTTGPISSGDITEDTIRRYLTRKPMTAKELVQKFKSKLPQMTKEQMTQKIGQVLKKINPDRKYVNNQLFLSVKKKE